MSGLICEAETTWLSAIANAPEQLRLHRGRCEVVLWRSGRRHGAVTCVKRTADQNDNCCCFSEPAPHDGTTHGNHVFALWSDGGDMVQKTFADPRRHRNLPGRNPSSTRSCASFPIPRCRARSLRCARWERSRKSLSMLPISRAGIASLTASHSGIPFPPLTASASAFFNVSIARKTRVFTAPSRTAGDLGDLRVRQPLIPRQKNRLPLLGSQRLQRLLHSQLLVSALLEAPFRPVHRTPAARRARRPIPSPCCRPFAGNRGTSSP